MAIHLKKAQTSDKGRMDFRLDRKIKARVVRAASIIGQGLTDFAVSTLSERPIKSSRGMIPSC